MNYKNWSSRTLCCVRYVHVGKSAGTTFEEVVGLQLYVRDATTFHYPLSYFFDKGLLQPACLVGITLRRPRSFFESSYHWCRGRSCKRVNVGCGFLGCTKNSQLDREYRDPKSKLTIEGFARRAEEWGLGRNVVTRILGHPIGKSSVKSQDEELRKASLLTNKTVAGRRYFRTALERLAAFDFVLIFEDLEASYAKFFGSAINLPHANTQPAYKTTDPALADRIDALFDLDVALYNRGVWLLHSLPPFDLAYRHHHPPDKKRSGARKPPQKKSRDDDDDDGSTCRGANRSTAPLVLVGGGGVRC